MRRFRIEYLSESTRESSVCHKVRSRAETLDDAEVDAIVGLAMLGVEVDGFQIKDAANGRIIGLRHLWL